MSYLIKTTDISFSDIENSYLFNVGDKVLLKTFKINNSVEILDIRCNKICNVEDDYVKDIFFKLLDRSIELNATIKAIEKGSKPFTTSLILEVNEFSVPLLYKKDEDVKQAESLLNTGNFHDLKKMFSKRVLNGDDPVANYYYGFATFCLHENEKSEDESLSLIKKSADSGYYQAINSWLNIIVSNSISPIIDIQSLNSNLFLMDKDAVEFENGDIVNKRFVELYKALIKSLKSNNPINYFNLGALYFLGYGIKCDYKKALYYFELSSNLGFSRADYYIGYIYKNDLIRIINYSDRSLTDDDIAKLNDDLEKIAIFYFKKSSEKGYTPAMIELGNIYNNCYNKIHGVRIAEAIKYFKMASENLDPEGDFNLGFIYLEGSEVDKDVDKAIEYFLKAGKNHFSSAYNFLGSMYKNGEEVIKDKTKAIEYYLLSYEIDENMEAFDSLNELDGDDIPSELRKKIDEALYSE